MTLTIWAPLVIRQLRLSYFSVAWSASDLAQIALSPTPKIHANTADAHIITSCSAVFMILSRFDGFTTNLNPRVEILMNPLLEGTKKTRPLSRSFTEYMRAPLQVSSASDR